MPQWSADVRPIRRGPLRELSDGEVLRLVASNLQTRARIAPAGERVERLVLVDAAGRLRSIARRVPLWTARR
jgi:hypothetical protein